jgi:hypothetical protein
MKRFLWGVLLGGFFLAGGTLGWLLAEQRSYQRCVCGEDCPHQLCAPGCPCDGTCYGQNNCGCWNRSRK